jgi:hypothetical protein
MNTKMLFQFVSSPFSWFCGLLLMLCTFTSAQSEKHIWKSLTTTKPLMWYDASQLDTVQSDEFKVWVVELAPTAFKLEGVPAPILRTKTLYTINRKLYRYGIRTTVYYDAMSREITRLENSTDNFSAEVRMPFPIYKSSVMNFLFAELDKKRIQK